MKLRNKTDINYSTLYGAWAGGAEKELPDDDAEALLKEFPDVFEKVDGRDKVEDTPEEEDND